MASRNRTANIQSRASQKAGQWRDDMGDNIYGDYTVEASTGTVTSGIGYVPGVGFDDPSLGNVAAYIGTDLIGTERRVVDSSTGGSPVIHRSILTAFGEPVINVGTGSTRYGYAGDWGYESPEQSFDPLADLGWQHVGERYYDPAIGRFMQRDPIGIRGGLNVYAYVANRPTFIVDPSGLTIIVDIQDVGGVITGAGGVLFFVPIPGFRPVGCAIMAVGGIVWGVGSAAALIQRHCGTVDNALDMVGMLIVGEGELVVEAIPKPV